jgi:hypothetical protein
MIVLYMFNNYSVTLALIVCTIYSRKEMDGRRTSSFPDLTATPGEMKHQGSTRLHASALDLHRVPAHGDDGVDEDEDDEPPDDSTVAAGTELLDYDSDNSIRPSVAGLEMPGTSTDTITTRIPEPMNIDISAEASQ